MLPSRMRSFSTSRAYKLGLSDIYNSFSRWRTPKSRPKVNDPTQDATKTDMTEDSQPVKLRVIGAPPRLEDEWPQVEQYARFNAWPTSHHNSALTKESIDTVLASVSNTDLANIETRLEVLKSISKQTDIAIPDHALEKVSDVTSLRRHLLDASKRFDERRPDAVYFDAAEYAGTNVVFHDTVHERRSRKARLEKLYEDALAAQNAKKTDTKTNEVATDE